MSSVLIGIYAIRNTVNGKLYIGSSNNIKARWRQHKCDLNKGRHHSSKLQHAWVKYGASRFVLDVLELIEDIDILPDKERHYIAHYDSIKRGYNFTSRFDGIGNRGGIWSAEARKNIMEGINRTHEAEKAAKMLQREQEYEAALLAKLGKRKQVLKEK